MSVGVCEAAIHDFFFFICVFLCQCGTYVSVCEAAKDDVKICVCVFAAAFPVCVCVCVRGV